ncbi:MAG: BMP family ABC transporter substrate-binding protein [Firmicutes bacterium]|nr:BMP family ABC transporter substrate-binding protein [Bacillota bacterium]
MKKIITVIMILVMVFSMAACGGGGEESGQKAACVLGVGGLGDQGYNDLIYAGMERAKEELGIDFDYAEPKQVTDFEQIMRDLSDSGEYMVIVCVGFDQMDALTKVSADYPEQNYAFIDGFIDADNIVNYTCREQEGSFLVGALAALMKEDAATYGLEANKNIGFVGAMENDTILRFAAGYDAGAKYITPDMNVDIQYVAGDNPFGDTNTAKEIATNQFKKGSDIVYHAAGGSGLGVFTAAKESDFIAIGCNSNQNVIDPDHIVASMLKRVDTASFEIVKAASEGTLKLGEEVVLGLEQGGIGYTLEKSNIKVSDEIVNKLADLEQKIIKGEIEVPVNFN